MLLIGLSAKQSKVFLPMIAHIKYEDYITLQVIVETKLLKQPIFKLPFFDFIAIIYLLILLKLFLIKSIILVQESQVI